MSAESVSAAAVGVWKICRDSESGFYAVRHDIIQHRLTPTEETIEAPTLGELRALLPKGLLGVARHKTDDDATIEWWR